MTNSDLIERFCRSLAFHVIETELTTSMAEGDLSEWHEECKTARDLIEEAGFDIDELYPVADRPTAMRQQ